MRLPLRIILTCLVVIVSLYPWTASIYDARLKGFDKAFLYLDPKGTGSTAGNITVTKDQLFLTSVPGSAPMVELSSSEASYSAEADLTIISDSSSSIPARITVFFPFTAENVTVDFYGSNRTMEGYVSETGSLLRNFPKNLGTYAPAHPIHIAVNIQKGGSVTITVSTGRTTVMYAAGTDVAPTLLAADRRVVQVESRGGQGQSSVQFENFVISVPHDEFFAPKSDDRFLIPVCLSLAAIVIVTYHVEISKIPRFFSRARRRLMQLPRRLVWLLLVSLFLQTALTPLGGHPHDIFAEKAWIYTLMTEGLADLYFRPLVTVVAQPFGGVPYQHAVYPYPPVLAYFYYAVSAPLAGLGLTSTQNFGFELASKMISILGNLASGILVYLLAGKLARTKERALVASAAYLLNPALVFDAAVWGETDSILIVFLLAAVLFLFLRKTGFVWASLALAVLTKQTAIVPALLIGMLSFRYAGLKSNMRGVSTGLSVAFVSMIPFVAVGYSPFVMLSQTVLRLSQFALGIGQLPTSSPIAADAYSFLPLISTLNGLTGRNRMWYPDATLVTGLGISYSALGKVLLALTGLPLLYWGIRKASSERKDLDLLLVAVLTSLSFFFPTKVSGRYFVIPLALIAPVVFTSPRGISRLGFWAFTATTFTSMLYLIASWSIYFPGASPALAYVPALPVADFFQNAFDWLLDLAVLANTASIVLWVKLLLEEGRVASRRETEQKMMNNKLPRVQETEVLDPAILESGNVSNRPEERPSLSKHADKSPSPGRRRLLLGGHRRRTCCSMTVRKRQQ